MRTTIELPDPVFRRMKAVAALQGSTIKEFVQKAVERELGSRSPSKRHRVKLPLICATPGRTIKPLSRGEVDELMFG